MSRKQVNDKLEVPSIVIDARNNKQYRRGKLLGRGGFAKCYELTDNTTGVIYAGKVVAKSQLVKQDQREKMVQEIEIHRSISHKHIVQFYGTFEDSNFIYIILEICNRRSLMELHKRRKQIPEDEIRYFVRQIAEGCQYLHENKIVHRDLKLGNLFLNDNMEIKIGDFGLATKIRNEGDRKLTLCGTPNYIAPEVLNKKGHSYEVDIWSLGCIVYTLAVGKPPFETTELKDTYRKIKLNDYKIPSTVSDEIAVFIRKMLQTDPKLRPTMKDVLKDSFMAQYIPSRLPQQLADVGRLSLLPSNQLAKMSPRRPLIDMGNNEAAKNGNKEAQTTNSKQALEANNYCLRKLSNKLEHLLNTKPSEREEIMEDEAEDPVSAPIYWISKWVDYTDKYGIGYQLCDNSFGVVFNDLSRMIIQADKYNMEYIQKDGSEHCYNTDKYPQEISKKVTLLRYFCNYMDDHLVKSGEKPRKDGEDIEKAKLPYLNNWFRTRNAIVFQLTNGTVQVNFFHDHTKVILCPLMGAITYVNDKQVFRTFKFDLIEKYGCSKEITTRLSYVKSVVHQLMQHKLSANTKSSKRR